jgi:cytidine deaminase
MKNEELMMLAKEAIKNSYSPYSDFPVGAALLTKDGKVFTGVNIENASFGLTACAERIAIYNAINSGEREFKALAVYAKKSEVTPCGACRQVIAEFSDDIDIIFYKNKKLVVKKISELLPDTFGKENIS